MLAGTLCGCTQTFDATTLGVPVTMGVAAGDTPVGQRFKVSTHTVHGIFGLFTISKAKMDKALATQLAANGITSLAIKVWGKGIYSPVVMKNIMPRTRPEWLLVPAALRELYGRWRAGAPLAAPDWQVIRRFDRRRLTGDLAAIFDEVTDASGLHR